MGVVGVVGVVVVVVVVGVGVVVGVVVVGVGVGVVGKFNLLNLDVFVGRLEQDVAETLKIVGVGRNDEEMNLTVVFLNPIVTDVAGREVVAKGVDFDGHGE
jgi:hypothetical protein